MKPLTHDQTGTCRNGYTLIEVLIAMAIFSIGFLAVSTMQISAINSNANARSQTTVLNYAKDKIEDLMALDYSHADLAAGPHSDAAGNLNPDADGIDNNENGEIDESAEAGHIGIEWVVTEIDLNGDTFNDAKSIRVTVTRDASGRQRQATLDVLKVPL